MQKKIFTVAFFLIHFIRFEMHMDSRKYYLYSTIFLLKFIR